MAKAKKTLLIDRLIDEDWFGSSKEAQPWLMAGKVLVDTRQITSGKVMVARDAEIRVKEYYKRKYAGKGGLKLEGALAAFAVDVRGSIALDCGASTGGFTDCLIQHGAKRVYAVDVGHGELAGKLLINENVINMERTNISDESLCRLDPAPELITLDLSYLSLKKALQPCKRILAGKGEIIALIKPIVEVDSAEIKRSGDINRHEVIRDILSGLCGFFARDGFDIAGLTHSPIKGNSGAIEYFAHLCVGGEKKENINSSYPMLLDEIIEKSFALEKFDKNNVQRIG